MPRSGNAIKTAAIDPNLRCMRPAPWPGAVPTIGPVVGKAEFATRRVMSRADRPAVVVIGAGISGLTCLWQLRRAGVDAVCLETSSRAGGALASRRAEGFVVETGASTVLETPEMVRLADEAGLASDIVRSEPGLPRFILRGGALHPL